MGKLEISILAGFLIAVLVSAMTPFAEECEKIRDDVIRIHIIANSNSDEDQSLKLRVKSEIAMKVSQILKDTNNKQEASEIINNNLDYIKDISKQQIIKNGYQYNVKVDLCKSYFGTREYDTFTLPAGTYDALKVIIGDGEGKNWWCVAFPPMCMPTQDCVDRAGTILDKDEIDVISNKSKYKYKFAIVEAFTSLKNLIDSRGQS